MQFSRFEGESSGSSRHSLSFPAVHFRLPLSNVNTFSLFYTTAGAAACGRPQLVLYVQDATQTTPALITSTGAQSGDISGFQYGVLVISQAPIFRHAKSLL